MKKVFILLLGALVVAGTGSCGRNQKAAEKQAELDKIQAQQDSARRADSNRLLYLQAQQDSIAMALAMSEASASAASNYSSYYIVVGSFLNRSNAKGYLETMKSMFDDAQIVNKGRWNLVCVGGRFDSYGSASRRLRDVQSKLGEGGGSSSGDDDDEGSDDEGDDDEGDDEDEDGGDSGDSGSSSGGGGSREAWICGL